MADLIHLVDLDVNTRRLARICLEEAGFSVRTFSSMAAIEQVQRARPSLILIAAALQDDRGMNVCRQIRQDLSQASTPIIVLTTGVGEDEICAALEAGADDCLTKPFSPRELVARVQGAIRRAGRSFPVESAEIVIDRCSMKLSVRGSEVITTTLEFRLVDYLARHRGHAFTRDMLLDAVWGEMQFVSPRSVDACIRRVREKIEPDLTAPTYVKTVRGVGYRFDAVAAWPALQESCSCTACAPLNSKSPKSRGFEMLRGRRTRKAASVSTKLDGPSVAEGVDLGMRRNHA